MLELTRNLGPMPHAPVTDRLCLDYASRAKARQKARLAGGEQVGIFLEYGKPLSGGDVLSSDDGILVRVECGPEPVITAVTEDWALLARGCYHLGNRHVPLQIGRLWLRFSPDPVLEELVRRLGFTALSESAPFAPEGGAYAGGHSHAHSHAHDHK